MRNYHCFFLRPPALLLLSRRPASTGPRRPPRVLTVLLEEPEGFDTDTIQEDEVAVKTHRPRLTSQTQRSVLPSPGTGSGGQAVDDTGEGHYLYRRPSRHQEVHRDTTEPRSGGAAEKPDARLGNKTVVVLKARPRRNPSYWRWGIRTCAFFEDLVMV